MDGEGGTGAHAAEALMVFAVSIAVVPEAFHTLNGRRAVRASNLPNQCTNFTTRLGTVVPSECLTFLTFLTFLVN